MLLPPTFYKFLWDTHGYPMTWPAQSTPSIPAFHIAGRPPADFDLQTSPTLRPQTWPHRMTSDDMALANGPLTWSIDKHCQVVHIILSFDSFHISWFHSLLKSWLLWRIVIHGFLNLREPAQQRECMKQFCWYCPEVPQYKHFELEKETVSLSLSIWSAALSTVARILGLDKKLGPTSNYEKYRKMIKLLNYWETCWQSFEVWGSLKIPTQALKLVSLQVPAGISD